MTSSDVYHLLFTKVTARSGFASWMSSRRGKDMRQPIVAGRAVYSKRRGMIVHQTAEVLHYRLDRHMMNLSLSSRRPPKTSPRSAYFARFETMSTVITPLTPESLNLQLRRPLCCAVQCCHRRYDYRLSSTTPPTSIAIRQLFLTPADITQPPTRTLPWRAWV